MLVLGLLPADPASSAGCPLQGGGRLAGGLGGQGLVFLGPGEAGESPDLVPGEAALGQSLGAAGQAGQGPGHADILLSGGVAETKAGAEPGLHGEGAVVAIGLALVQLCDLDQELGEDGGQEGAELVDAV